MSVKSVFNSFFVDLMSLKSKSAFLWALIIIGMSVVNMKSIAFIFLVSIVSLLFMNDERGMYATNFAPVNKKTSVLGRYIFAFLLFTVCLVINLLADLIAPHFYSAYVSGNIYFYVLMFVLFIVLVSIELPLLYWKGYAKIRIFQYVIFFCVALLILKVVGEERLYTFIKEFNLTAQLAIPLLGAAIVLLGLSLLLSMWIYNTKDI